MAKFLLRTEGIPDNVMEVDYCPHSPYINFDIDIFGGSFSDEQIDAMEKAGIPEENFGVQVSTIEDILKLKRMIDDIVGTLLLQFSDVCTEMRVEEEEKHLGCPGYPNCDMIPNGCRHVMGEDVEWYGHKD